MPTRPAARRPKPVRSVVHGVCLALLVVLAGCVDADGELARDGRLTLRYTYMPPRHATVKSEEKRLSSPHVRLEHLERNQSLPGYPSNEFVTATLTVDDVRQLSSSAAFATVRVDADLSVGHLTFTFPGLDAETRERARSAIDAGTIRQALKVHLRLPGTVTGAEPPATIAGSEVTWQLSFKQVIALGDPISLSVRWTPDSSS